jgi:hypothetical protein
MPEIISEYVFYFKIAYTEKTIYYRFSPNISIKNFIETVRYKAKIDFQLNDDKNIEVIEAGQFENINGRDAELAPALIPYNETLREIYGNNYNNTAFYLRII